MISTEALKEKEQILQELKHSTDEDLLHGVYQLLLMRNRQLVHQISQEELIERALESEKDIQEGKMISLNQLKTQVAKWHK